MSIDNKSEFTDLTEYPGRRREAALLALVCVGGPIACVTTMLAAGAHKSLTDLAGIGFVALIFGLLAWGALVLIRVLGMTVRIKGKVIEVEEWYGRRYLVPVRLPIVADHFLPVNIGMKLKLKLPDQQRRLSVGGVDVYVNLEERSNPDEAMSDLLSELNQIAAADKWRVSSDFRSATPAFTRKDQQ